MYRTCIHCLSDLETNDSIERLAVGRRLAFDAGRGRLGGVCRHCERWNLTPVEDRWEAIEDCERRFRAARRRYSTDQIGLARLPDGLELVRIGDPLRPEFAAWRYGDQFGRRRRKLHVRIGIGIAVAAGFVAAPVALGAGLGSAWGTFEFLMHGYNYWLYRATRRHLAHLDVGGGTRLPITAAQAANTEIGEESTGEQLVLLVPARNPGGFVQRRELIRIDGPAAIEAAGQLLRVVNRQGASRRQVEEAAVLLDESGPPEEHLASLVSQVRVKRYSGQRELLRQPAPLRLALEMATHERAERIWLTGELEALEQAWQSAEALAAIADRLALPAAIDRQLASLKEQGRIQT
ncbi:MAG: hypothetical protein AB7L66_08940 [Gemmatimonadales bacterium]